MKIQTARLLVGLYGGRTKNKFPYFLLKKKNNKKLKNE